MLLVLQLLLVVVFAAEERRCVFHLHMPKCAGTFAWRFLKSKFCVESGQICGRSTLRAPPACDCVVNPSSIKDGAVAAALENGRYRFVSAHSLAYFPKKNCALVAWFRDPVKRVLSHYGYLRDRRKIKDLPSLEDLAQEMPKWASNLQWSLFVGGQVKGSPSKDQRHIATLKLSSAAFVGVVERMDESLCLFAKTFLPAFDLCNNQLTTKENVALKQAKNDHHIDLLLRSHNRFDTALYDLALIDFQRRLALAPLTTGNNGTLLGGEKSPTS